MKIKFIFDIASPNSYLCHKVIPEFEAKHSVEFEYIPCLLGGIFKLTNNQPPMIAFSEIKNKADYMNLEIKRFINFHKIEEFQFNPFFPINTITIQRGSLVAKEEGIFSQYTDITAKAMWEQQINLGDAQILIDTLNTAGIDGKMIVDRASDPKIKESLIKNTQMAVDNGAFGVPTFFLHDDVFFGKEALREIPDFL